MADSLESLVADATAQIDALCELTTSLPAEVTGLLHMAAGGLAGCLCQPGTTSGRMAIVRRADTCEGYMVDFERSAAEMGRVDLALSAARVARICSHIARMHLDLAEVARLAAPILASMRHDTSYMVVRGDRK